MWHIFKDYESADGCFAYEEKLNNRKMAELMARYHAMEDQYRKDTGFDLKAEELRRHEDLPGITPFPRPLPDDVMANLQDAAAQGEEFTCPVEAYWHGGKVCFNTGEGFAHLVPELFLMDDEGCPSVKAAAQRARELFSRKYCGIKVVPVFYTVKDHPKPPAGDTAKIALFMLAQAKMGFFQTIKAAFGMAWESLKTEKPLTAEELRKLETLFSKA